MLILSLSQKKDTYKPAKQKINKPKAATFLVRQQSDWNKEMRDKEIDDRLNEPRATSSKINKRSNQANHSWLPRGITHEKNNR